MHNSTSENAQQKLVLMAGLPGVGKTTMARKLVKELGENWEVIDKDGRIEKLMSQGMQEEEASHQAYDESFDAIRKKLKDKKHSVILDTATLQSFILEEANAIASQMSVQLNIFFLVAERELRNERLRNRPPQITVIRVDPKSIDEYFLCFEHLPDFPDRFTLDTSKPLDECSSRALEFLLSNSYEREKLVDDEPELKRKSKAELVSQYSVCAFV